MGIVIWIDLVVHRLDDLITPPFRRSTFLDDCQRQCYAAFSHRPSHLWGCRRDFFSIPRTPIYALAAARPGRGCERRAVPTNCRVPCSGLVVIHAGVGDFASDPAGLRKINDYPSDRTSPRSEIFCLSQRPRSISRNSYKRINWATMATKSGHQWI